MKELTDHILAVHKGLKQNVQKSIDNSELIKRKKSDNFEKNKHLESLAPIIVDEDNDQISSSIQTETKIEYDATLSSTQTETQIEFDTTLVQIEEHKKLDFEKDSENLPNDDSGIDNDPLNI